MCTGLLLSFHGDSKSGNLSYVGLSLALLGGRGEKAVLYMPFCISAVHFLNA